MSTLAEWLAAYEREEDAQHVIAHCDGGDFDDCAGWVLTMRQSIYPHETPLTDAERAEVGLPADRWAHMNWGLYDGAVRWRVLLSSASSTNDDDLFATGEFEWVDRALARAAEIEQAQPGVVAWVLPASADAGAFLRAQGLA